jgi:hypothetical protein
MSCSAWKAALHATSAPAWTGGECSATSTTVSDSPLIRDVVLPVVTTTPDGDGLALQHFLGSGFLIGPRGYALTAAHIIPPEADGLAVLTASGAEWRAHVVEGCEAHPTQDVAVLKVVEPLTPSRISVAGAWEGQSLPYRSWGYPESVMYEIVDNGVARPRPDLVYTQGYIRRRVSWSLSALVGSQFFELSEAAGGGCSGGPVLRMDAGDRWLLVGVYVGQRETEGAEPVRVGYAAREESFRDWRPELLGRTVIEESRD